MTKKKDLRGETDSGFKVRHAIQTVATFILVASLAGKVTVNFQLALGVFLNFQFWGLLWWKILLTSPNIYSLRVSVTLLHDWVPLSLPSGDGAKMRKDRVVTSISELSGIRGTHMMLSLRVMTGCMNMLVLASIQQHLHFEGTTLFQLHDPAPTFMLIQTIGFFLTGHFELNHMDSVHTLGHYLGVLGIMVGSCSVGFVFRWNIYSKMLVGLECGLCIFWSWYCAKVVKKSSDIAVVTRNSKLCIGIELVMFYVTNVMLTSTVYASGRNEGNLFASPFL